MLTLSSLSLRHSSQPPSNAFFMRLIATTCLPRYSGRVRGPLMVVPGGNSRGECQSASQTVPNEPSPTSLSMVNERGADGGGNTLLGPACALLPPFIGRAVEE